MMDRNLSREQLLGKINEVSFAVDDILLFLDTHPCSEEALAYYREAAGMRRELMEEYANCYGPLTVDDAVHDTCGTWKWMTQPFPWQMEGGR